mmetsp:Transcript_19577/g.34930  ORF Transcript_19577/g.34930 Transcript_19577/m.34930 type:complete len:120 (+) Transcript_19577:1767-2126(+)
MRIHAIKVQCRELCKEGVVEALSGEWSAAWVEGKNIVKHCLHLRRCGAWQHAMKAAGTPAWNSKATCLCQTGEVWPVAGRAEHSEDSVQLVNGRCPTKDGRPAKELGKNEPRCPDVYWG